MHEAAAGGGGGFSILAAADALDAAARDFGGAVAAVDADLSAVSELLDINLERLMPLVTGGFADGLCATAFARTWLPQRKRSQKAEPPPAVKGLPAGEGFLRREAAARAARLRACVDAAVVGIGASYANAMSMLAEEAEARCKPLREQ